jgi:hypothetical protein
MKAQLLSYQIHTAVVHPGILCPARPFWKTLKFALTLFSILDFNICRNNTYFWKNRNDKQPILGTGLNCSEFCL